MFKWKRIISVIMVLDFIPGVRAGTNINSSDANLSKTEKFELKKKDINEKSYNKFSKKEIFDQYNLCEEALKEQKKNAKYGYFAMFFTPLIPTVAFLPILYTLSKFKDQEFHSLRVLDYKDITSETVANQNNDSYNCFSLGDNFHKAVRADINCYIDAIKYFGNKQLFTNFLHETYFSWPAETQKKILDYLRLSGVLGWTCDDNEKDKTDAYIVVALAYLAISQFSTHKKIDIDDFLVYFKDLCSNRIYVSIIGDFYIYTFSFFLENNIKGKYIICHNKKDNKIVVFPDGNYHHYYVLDMNSYIDGHSNYPSLSRFLICSYDTVMRSIYVPPYEKVQALI